MFRVLQDINEKNADATKTAAVALVCGMGVQKSGNNIVLPTSATAEDIFFVTKEKVPAPCKAMMGDISDYDEDFENIKSGEMAVLVKPIIGEIYWVDQNDTVAVGDYVVAGTDGKFEKTTSGKSNLKVISLGIKDAGVHDGIAIEVVDWHTAG